MNTRFLTTHSLRAALLLGGLLHARAGANAQSPIAKANVPFEFAAGGAMMPPGEYTVDVPDLAASLCSTATPEIRWRFSPLSGTRSATSATPS